MQHLTPRGILSTTIAEAFERVVVSTPMRVPTPSALTIPRTGDADRWATFPNTRPGLSRALSWIPPDSPAMNVLARRGHQLLRRRDHGSIEGAGIEALTLVPRAAT